MSFLKYKRNLIMKAYMNITRTFTTKQGLCLLEISSMKKRAIGVNHHHITAAKPITPRRDPTKFFLLPPE